MLRKGEADSFAHEKFCWEADRLHSMRHPYLLNSFGTCCSSEWVRHHKCMWLLQPCSDICRAASACLKSSKSKPHVTKGDG